jgi:hypothetical protein
MGEGSDTHHLFIENELNPSVLWLPDPGRRRNQRMQLAEAVRRDVVFRNAVANEFRRNDVRPAQAEPLIVSGGAG